jgi:diguanylate cyclase (GGDEF)-like protein
MKTPSPTLTRLANGLLTTDAKQRIRLGNALTGTLLMLLCIAIAEYTAPYALANTLAVHIWAVLAAGGLLGFFCLIRSGATLDWQDPSLTALQMAYAITCSATAYVLLGSASAVTLPILSLTLMFGIFGLSPRQAIAIAVFSTLAFGAAIALQPWVQPFTPYSFISVINGLMMLIVITGATFLSLRHFHLRDVLRRQRRELSAAVERIQELATRDELTGLFNRRHMTDLLKRERRRAERKKTSLLLVLIDIDRFKRVNDVHGHAAGDLVLKNVAFAIEHVLRETDTIGRWGGEEFVMLLPDTDLPVAKHVLSRIRASLAHMTVPVAGEQLTITVSMGVTVYRHGEPIEYALERADQALYSAKDNGRDRVVVG